MNEIERLKQEIEKYARDRDWEMHANAVQRLILYMQSSLAERILVSRKEQS